MKLERINTVKGFCGKRSQRISELHRNSLNDRADFCTVCHMLDYILMEKIS